jgi:hypothetical protein
LQAFLDEQDRLIAQARAAAPFRPKGFIALTELVYEEPNLTWRSVLVRADAVKIIQLVDEKHESHFPYSPRLRLRCKVRVGNIHGGIDCAETVDEVTNRLGCEWFSSAERAAFMRIEHPFSTTERPVECYTSPTSSVRIADALRDLPERVPETPEATIDFGIGRSIRHRGTARELFKMYAGATGAFCVNEPGAAPSIASPAPAPTPTEQAADVAPENPRGASLSGLRVAEEASTAPIPHPAMESCQEDGPVAAQPVSARPIDAAEPAAAEGTDTGAEPKGAIEAGVPAVVRATGQRVNVLRTATDSGGRGYAECELLDDAGVAVDVNEFFVDELHTAAEAA